jgi:hypothetical protein
MADTSQSTGTTSSNDWSKAMNELLSLIRQYDSYYQMSDDGPTWHRGHDIDRQIRALVRKLRAEGHGEEIDALLDEYPQLVASPNGRHALA